MSWFDSILLGILQGLTEFLPVSSSGHLVVFQHLLGLREPQLVFDVLVHLGTLAAVILYYRRQIVMHSIGCFRKDGEVSRRLILMIVLASIPTGLIGLFFEDLFESLFASPFAVGIFWVVTGIALIVVPRLSSGSRELEDLKPPDAVLVGIAQGLAILPGVSRSGATILTGMARGIHPRAAADFSFLISIPAILGATLLQAKKAASVSSAEWPIFIAGAIAAAVVGYAAIAVLIRMLKQRRIQPFGWYCIAAGSLTLVLLAAA